MKQSWPAATRWTASRSADPLLEQGAGHDQGVFATASNRVVITPAADFIEAVALVQAIGRLVAGTHFEETLTTVSA